MTAPTRIITRIWTVDLKTAKHFLSFETEHKPGEKGTNRKASDETVNSYAVDMLRGNWGFSHQGFAFIGFLNDGTADFRDGTQRARALVQACTVGAQDGEEFLPPNPDFTFDVMVTEGLDEGSWKIMDIGRRRTFGNMLGMEGDVNTLALGSAIHLSLLYERNTADGRMFQRDQWVSRKARPTVAARLQYIEDNPALRPALIEGARLNKFMTVGAAAAGYYLALKYGVDPAKVDDFMDQLASGAGLDVDSPALRLREMLKNARNKKRNLPREDQLALFIKALNAHVAGRTLKYLSFRTEHNSRAGSEPFPRFQV